MIIDTHCHLYLKEFDTDCKEVIQRSIDAGIDKFFLPAIDSTTTEAMLRLEAEYPHNCFAMMGLHPCSVQADYIKELELVSSWLAKRKFAAIGEIGLDLHWDKSTLKEQTDALHRQIEMAITYDLPVVLHTRNAMEETLDVIAQYSGKARGVFHCFGGSLKEANRAIELGFYLGIGGVVTYKKSGLDPLLKHIDLAHLVLETDAPYLTPVPFRGKRNESSYLIYVLDKIAEIKSIESRIVAEQTTRNAKMLFSI